MPISLITTIIIIIALGKAIYGGVCVHLVVRSSPSLACTETGHCPAQTGKNITIREKIKASIIIISRTGR